MSVLESHSTYLDLIIITTTSFVDDSWKTLDRMVEVPHHLVEKELCVLLDVPLYLIDTLLNFLIETL